MRLLFVDTETTGLSPRRGDRVVEVACVEMCDGRLTGREFHRLIDPQRPVPAEVAAIHGLDDTRLRGQPVFAAIAPELLDLIGDGRVVMHNAPFDRGFFAAEFARLDLACPALTDPGRIIDTLPRFRVRHPGQPCSLSALCERHGLAPESGENWHGALTDARMLARLWLAAVMAV